MPNLGGKGRCNLSRSVQQRLKAVAALTAMLELAVFLVYDIPDKPEE